MKDQKKFSAGLLHANMVSANGSMREQPILNLHCLAMVRVLLFGLLSKVLGLLLLVVYINDLLDNINSTGHLFADDTKIFRKITSEDHNQ